jgi:hypothetical protein
VQRLPNDKQVKPAAASKRRIGWEDPMEPRRVFCTVYPMSTKGLRHLLWTLLLLSASTSLAQSPFLYRLTFRGTVYETNGTGNFVGTALTEQTILEDAARRGNRDPKTLALAYHIQASGLGDTIEVVDAANGATLAILFGLYFWADTGLGRTAATNASATEVRQLDYLYTQHNTAFTSFNTHSMGSAFTTKRFIVADTPNGAITNTIVDARMSWIVNPQGTSGTKLCTGSFTTTTPLP